ncbi:hypothetical protein [Williamsia muralis]|uniref:hypothetical protein n=1 Tax=Williamsia marianensis TaxID=85044 RepID=UPI003F5CBFF9
MPIACETTTPDQKTTAPPPEPSAGRYSRPTSRVGNFDEHHWGIFLSPVISSSLNRVRRPARALATDMPGVWISDRVVKQLLATQIRTGLGRLVVFASLDGAGDQIHAVRIGLIARYRDDLPVMSDHIRDAVEDVLVRTLGAKVTTQACRAIHVRWQDVYSREWLS